MHYNRVESLLLGAVLLSFPGSPWSREVPGNTAGRCCTEICLWSAAAETENISRPSLLVACHCSLPVEQHQWLQVEPQLCTGGNGHVKNKK